MPSVNDILTVAQALEKSPIAVLRDNCVAVRNRNARCRRCMEACENGALDVCGNDITLNASACNACGACVMACPVEALVSLNPTDSELLESATAALQVMGDVAVIACARISAKRQADPSTYAEVPCLPRVGETLILSLAVLGARRVLLVDGDCATCKNRDCALHVGEVVSSARDLLSAQGSATTVERMAGFPEEMLKEDAKSLHGSTRRAFFAGAAVAAKESAMTAAQATVMQELGLDASQPAIGERLRVTGEGTLPRVNVPRHEATINALDALGQPQADFIESRLFGSVFIDESKCNSCNMCAVFCPTGALRRDETDDMSAPLRYLEFSACDCVQCGLCVDVCWKGAVTLSARVGTQELFDFEPVTFHMANAPKKKSPLG